MKRLILLSLILMGLVLTGCNLPSSTLSPDVDPDDSMATEISKILTGTPIIVDPTATVQSEGTAYPPLEETDVVEPDATETPAIDEEEKTATPEATTTTLADTDPVKNLGAADWVDNMDDGDNWPTGFNEYTTIKFADGTLKLTAEKEVDGWRLSWPFLGDFYLEATLQSPECAGGDHFGLMFRVPANANANQGYLFGITCNGQYSVRRWDSKTMYSLASLTAHDAINQGENVVNKLGVMADGADLVFYINGQKVKELSDSAYLEGSFGIFVGGSNADTPTVWVDQIRYWTIP